MKTHLRMAPGTVELWDNLRNVVERLHPEGLSIPRRFRGRITDSEVLHFAIAIALKTLDPDHVMQEPLPLPPGAKDLREATISELVLELGLLSDRLQRVVLMLAHLGRGVGVHADVPTDVHAVTHAVTHAVRALLGPAEPDKPGPQGAPLLPGPDDSE